MCTVLLLSGVSLWRTGGCASLIRGEVFCGAGIGYIWSYGTYGRMVPMVVWYLWSYGTYGRMVPMVVWYVWSYGTYGRMDALHQNVTVAK